MIDQMFIDRAGIPFILVAVVLAGLAAWSGGRGWAVPFLVLAAFFVFFFRDPDRTSPSDPNLVVSPADGRVMLAAASSRRRAHRKGNGGKSASSCRPMDVHVNRTPVEGTVTHVEYHPGKFLPAYKVEAGQLNEWTEVWFERQGRAVVCRQIVGILARRIVCRLRTATR